MNTDRESQSPLCSWMLNQVQHAANGIHCKPIMYDTIPSKTETGYSSLMNADPDWRPEVDRLRTQLWALELRFAWFRLYVISAACTALTITIPGARIILS